MRLAAYTSGLLLAAVLSSVADKKMGTKDMPEPDTVHRPSFEKRKPIELGSKLSINEVKLTEACPIQIVRDGKVIASVALPAGTIAKVVRVESNQLWIIHGSTTNRIPASATDYSERLQTIRAMEAAEQGRKEQIESERRDAERVAERKKEWYSRHELYHGNVQQVVKDGLLVKVDGIGTVLLVGSSKQNEHVDGDRIKFYAESVGRHQYTSVMGATKTIDKWKIVNEPIWPN